MKTGERVTDATTRIPKRKTDANIGFPARATKATRLALVTGLGLVVVAAPPSGLAVRLQRAGGRETAHDARARTVSFAPLFDTFASFKAKESVLLRFRATLALSGSPIRPQDITFSLRQGAEGKSRALPTKPVRKGVFEVPFSPEARGQYWVTASIRRHPEGTIPAVRLEVVGPARAWGGAPPGDDPA
jgi:hypothetical protein